jgi:hypothetical protein
LNPVPPIFLFLLLPEGSPEREEEYEQEEEEDEEALIDSMLLQRNSFGANSVR